MIIVYIQNDSWHLTAVIVLLETYIDDETREPSGVYIGEKEFIYEYISRFRDG
ncbi:hypothetical protein [Virgibacillus sp. YIM 98842]|uniref:hypothetical protein n=1 Tax=Virgibacillus sp. YIM 98842 TaxID=2663533 RepID=UPI0013DB1A64|nr:hypothetical protein [Virgibacillus sp. YIM 98842]